MPESRKRRIGCVIPGSIAGLLAACLLMPLSSGSNFTWLIVAVGLVVVGVGLQLVMDSDRGRS